MSIKIFNSLTKLKEEFVPIEDKKVKIYVCGQTVYDYCHLGHARKEVSFDVVRRWFIASGYDVLFVENITDIDDKIIARAKDNQETISNLTSKFINYMHEDFARLNILKPDIEPKATDYIDQMVLIIEELLQQGIAYMANNGDVYYSVNKFKNYGCLSGQNLDDLNAGSRVDTDTVNKKNPLDFVLWKASKEDEDYWESSIGNGRPGWHIECSAMSESLLGKNFDIHGGGQDLKFPHHENEIAQSEVRNHCKLANYWMHNGFLNFNDEKMSKSLGNFFTLRDILNKHYPEALRLLILKTHYRSPLNFTEELLLEAKTNLDRLYIAIRSYYDDNNELNINPIIALNQINIQNKANLQFADINWNLTEYFKKFKAAMDDDFNTPVALSVVFELLNEYNKSKNLSILKAMINLANILGLLFQDYIKYFQGIDNTSTLAGFELDNNYIEGLINERNLARKNKDFKKSDEIREKLSNLGIILEDLSNKTIWRKN